MDQLASQGGIHTSRDPVTVGVEKPRPDLVLVTVNEFETKAVHDAFLEAAGAEGVPVSLEGRLYHNLGTVNGTTVYHAISEMGSGGPGAMQQAVDKAIRALDPGAVIAVGIAFGVNEKDQAIGDILLSKQIQLYELQRAGREIVIRGDKPHATPRLINHFEAFKQVRWKGARVRPGLILSGEKLIDDKDYRNQLVTMQVEAVGGEMEGAGLYVASADHKVDWIVIKAICDWADGNKKVNRKQRQKRAAKNAAEFVVESLKYAALKRVDLGRPAQKAPDNYPTTDPVGCLIHVGTVRGPQSWTLLAEVRFTVTNTTARKIHLSALQLVIVEAAPLDKTMGTTTAGPVDETVLIARIGQHTRNVDILPRPHVIDPSRTDGFFLKIEAEEGFSYRLRIEAEWQFLGDVSQSSQSREFPIAVPAHSVEGLLRIATRSSATGG